MNALAQRADCIIGSGEAASGLAEASRARILVLSDSHGDAAVLRAALEAFGPSCGALVFCGDGADDLAAALSVCAEIAPPVAAAARGNGDAREMVIRPAGEAGAAGAGGGAGRAPLSLRFTVPERAVFRAAGRTVFAAHGHRHSVGCGTELISRAASLLDADIVLFGHTHRPFVDASGAALVLNPGSCSRPRGLFPPTCAVVTCPGAAERFDAAFYRIRRSASGSIDFERFPL